MQNTEERLQKTLARAGIASRRASEELIQAGRVRVNGKIVTQLGTKINPATDRVTVDDQPIAVRLSAAPPRIYIALHKPTGYLSTVSDPQGRPTVMDLINSDERLFPVGRLDVDTSGLLLLTNDGAFANALMHPRYNLEKEYLALLDGIIPLKKLDTLRKGVVIPVENNDTGEVTDYQTLPAKIDFLRHEGSNTLIRFILTEGKKRQVRLMAQAVGTHVLSLTRVRFGSLKLSDLGEGKYRNLSKEEIKTLLEAATKESEVRSQKSGGRKQEARDRSQESEVRSQKSGVRSEKTGDGRQGTGRNKPNAGEASALDNSPRREKGFATRSKPNVREGSALDKAPPQRRNFAPGRKASVGEGSAFDKTSNRGKGFAARNKSNEEGNFASDKTPTVKRGFAARRNPIARDTDAPNQNPKRERKFAIDRKSKAGESSIPNKDKKAVRKTGVGSTFDSPKPPTPRTRNPRNSKPRPGEKFAPENRQFDRAGKSRFQKASPQSPAAPKSGNRTRPRRKVDGKQ